MITAVDTNILFDILIPDAPHGEQSERALIQALGTGALVICEPVYAELGAQFPSRGELDRFLNDTRVQLMPSGGEALYQAGRAWSEYRRRRSPDLECPQCGSSQIVQCERCGRRLTPRQHVVADFLIGAHALVHADQLLTRDRGYYATYFPQLVLTA